MTANCQDLIKDTYDPVHATNIITTVITAIFSIFRYQCKRQLYRSQHIEYIRKVIATIVVSSHRHENLIKLRSVNATTRKYHDHINVERTTTIFISRLIHTHPSYTQLYSRLRLKDYLQRTLGVCVRDTYIIYKYYTYNVCVTGDKIDQMSNVMSRIYPYSRIYIELVGVSSGLESWGHHLVCLSHEMIRKGGGKQGGTRCRLEQDEKE